MAVFFRPHVWDKFNEKNKKKKKSSKGKSTQQKSQSAGQSSHSQGSHSGHKSAGRARDYEVDYDDAPPDYDDVVGFNDDIWQINSPTSAQTDLLGLSSPPVNNASAPPMPGMGGNAGMLVDILGDMGASPGLGSNIMGNGAAPSPPTFGGSDDFGMAVAQDNFSKFIAKHNGILFENDLLQVGVKSEYRQNMGRISLFYGNKTQSILTEFKATLLNNPEDADKISVTCTKPADAVVNAGEQKQQLIEIECLTDFNKPPKLQIAFMYSRVQQNITVRLPIMINKFLEPAEMDEATFFMRWKALGNVPTQTCEKIIEPTQPQSMGSDVVKAKLLGFGASILDGIDPNPDNFIMTGIVHARGAQIGVLMRLEASLKAMAYRLTVRSTKDTVAKEMCELLATQL